MNELPRREPAPLYPRPGSFEQTLRRARRRRQITTALAAAAFVVVCGGGVAGGMALSGNAQPGTNLAGPNTSSSSNGSGNSTHRSTAPSSLPSGVTSSLPGNGPTQSLVGPPTAGNGPTGSHTRSHSSHPPQTSSGPVYRGQAVNSAGKPLSQIGVYVEQGGKPVKVATTSADGSFQIPCTNGPVLLAAGSFASGPSAGSGQNYAYTYVDKSQTPACTPTSATATATATFKPTVMSPGGRITVNVTDPSGKPIAGSTEPALYCDATAATPCYTMTADGSGSYTYTGLATGDYTLRGAYSSQDVHVTAGQTITVPWTEGQAPSPSPTPSPTSSPPDTTSSQAPGSQPTDTSGANTSGPDTGSSQGTGGTSGPSNNGPDNKAPDAQSPVH